MMVEKVLGFKEKEVSKYPYTHIKWGKKYKDERACRYIVDSKELVSVVSVEWLEKYCKKRFDWLDSCVNKNSKEHLHRSIELEDLLSMVRLQAKKVK